jgi:hypothetical protein
MTIHIVDEEDLQRNLDIAASLPKKYRVKIKFKRFTNPETGQKAVAVSYNSMLELAYALVRADDAKVLPIGLKDIALKSRALVKHLEDRAVVVAAQLLSTDDPYINAEWGKFVAANAVPVPVSDGTLN